MAKTSARIGFITCSDLSRYFVSHKNPLLTHDDQLACDDLITRGYQVEPLIWGTPVVDILARGFDLLIVRSPWDYTDSEENRSAFLAWLNEVQRSNIAIVNPVSVLQWSFDKHYLQDLASIGVSIVPTNYVEVGESFEKIAEAFERWQQIVVKPCISAAAKDANLVLSKQDLAAFRSHFLVIRKNRAFMVQPFIEEIRTTGEWSLVFLNEQYSHAVHKLPKPKGWLVQDELGGSVRCDDPAAAVRAFAEDAYAKLKAFLGVGKSLLYARIDVMPGLHVGELELVEPELFFLDRRNGQPNEAALKMFSDAIDAAVARLTDFAPNCDEAHAKIK